MTRKNPSVSSNGTIRCAIYARTAYQLSSVTGAEKQIDLCRQAAQRKDWEVAESCIRIDHLRTSMEGRIGLQELIALAVTKPRPFEYLICDSIDMFGRDVSTRDQMIDAFTRSGIGLHFVSSGLDTSEPSLPLPGRPNLSANR